MTMITTHKSQFESKEAATRIDRRRGVLIIVIVTQKTSVALLQSRLDGSTAPLLSRIIRKVFRGNVAGIGFLQTWSEIRVSAKATADQPERASSYTPSAVNSSKA